MKIAHRGFTITESIVVSAIIVTLASILVPVLSRARRAGRITGAASNLHQIHIALTMYRQDHESNGPTAFEQMGLPGKHWYFVSYFGISRDLWRSPCGFDKAIFESAFTYVPGEVTYPLVAMSPEYMNPTTTSGNYRLYNGYLEKWGENAVGLIDNYCNEPGTLMFRPMTPKRELCVLLSGQLINKLTHNPLYLDLKPYSEPSEGQ